MNRLITIALVSFFLISSSAFSQQKQHSELPKEILIQGLQASTICMEIDGYGIRKLVKFYKENKDDTTASDSDADKSAIAASILYGGFLMEETLAAGIIHTFKDKYKMSIEEIVGLVKDETDAIRQSLVDKYDRFDNYSDFTTAYQVSLETCTKALQSFTTKAQTALKALEKPTTNP